MKCLLSVLVMLSLAMGHVQTVYVGSNVSLLTDGRYASPLVGVQLGTLLISSLELRATFETILTGSSVGADLLYRFPLADALSAYAGMGPEVLFSPTLQVQPALTVAQTTPLGDANFALHGALGLEYRANPFGFFGEMQPVFTPAPARLGYTKVRSGVNFYF